MLGNRVSKNQILNFIEGKVSAWNFLKVFTTELKNPKDCEHNNIDVYNERELICLDCGITTESV